MTRNSRFSYYYHLYSIDVLLGVLSGSVMAVKVVGVNPGFAWWIILPITVWWIYIADHLFDGFRLKEKTQNPRHLFFYNHRKKLIVMLCIVSILDLILIKLYLPFRMILFGGIIGAFVLIYLAAVHFSKTNRYIIFPKELFVAFLYTIGIWGGPILLTNDLHRYVLPILVFFMVTLSNLFIYSFFERDQDVKDGQITLLVAYGEKRALKIIYGWIMFSILFTLIVSIASRLDSVIFFSMMIFLVMLIAQAYLLHMASWFAINNRFRWLNEGIFLMPLAILF